MSQEVVSKQDLFLDALFGEANGDPVKAKKLAGYSSSTSTTRIMDSVQAEIVKRASHYLAANLPFACRALVSVMIDPTQAGAKERMSAAGQIMDRTGLIKQEGIKVSGGSDAILIDLPAKNDEVHD